MAIAKIQGVRVAGVASAVPATSCTLQMRLGLPKSCAAFDVGMGCSGFVYELWIATSLMVASEVETEAWQC